LCGRAEFGPQVHAAIAGCVGEGTELGQKNGCQKNGHPRWGGYNKVKLNGRAGPVDVTGESCLWGGARGVEKKRLKGGGVAENRVWGDRGEKVEKKKMFVFPGFRQV